MSMETFLSEEPEWLEKNLFGDMRLWQVMFLCLAGVTALSKFIEQKNLGLFTVIKCLSSKFVINVKVYKCFFLNLRSVLRFKSESLSVSFHVRMYF